MPTGGGEDAKGGGGFGFEGEKASGTMEGGLVWGSESLGSEKKIGMVGSLGGRKLGCGLRGDVFFFFWESSRWEKLHMMGDRDVRWE